MRTTLFIITFLFSCAFSFSQNWKKIESNTKLRLNSISFGSELVGYIGAEGGTLFKTTDGGRNWNIIIIDSSLIGFPMDITDVDFQSATHGYLIYNYAENPVSHRGYAMFTKDGGVSWTASPFWMCGPLGVHMVDTANGYIFGAACFGGRTIDKITNRTIVSTTYNTNYTDFLRGMDFLKPHYGITAGDHGFVYRTTNSGAKWDTINPSFSQSFNDIKFVNDSLIFAVIDSNRSIVYSSDSGNTWQRYVYSLNFFRPVMNSLVVSSLDTIYTVGQGSIGSSAIIHWGKADNPSWNEFSLFKINTKFNSVDMSNSTRAFAVGDSGIIYTNMDFLTSIEEKFQSYNLKVYPNPASSFVQIESEKIKSISLFSIDGKLLLEKVSDSPNLMRIDLPNYSNGLYVLRVTHEDNSVQTKKIALHL